MTITLREDDTPVILLAKEGKYQKPNLELGFRRKEAGGMPALAIGASESRASLLLGMDQNDMSIFRMFDKEKKVRFEVAMTDTGSVRMAIFDSNNKAIWTTP